MPDDRVSLGAGSEHAPHVVGNKPEDEAQRAQKGWSTADTWSFDLYLAGVIAGGVAELRERGHGAPDIIENADYEANLEEWRVILRKIERGFQQYADEAFTPGAPMPEFDEAFALFREWFGALWD